MRGLLPISVYLFDVSLVMEPAISSYDFDCGRCCQICLPARIGSSSHIMASSSASPAQPACAFSLQFVKLPVVCVDATIVKVHMAGDANVDKFLFDATSIMEIIPFVAGSTLATKRCTSGLPTWRKWLKTVHLQSCLLDKASATSPPFQVQHAVLNAAGLLFLSTCWWRFARDEGQKRFGRELFHGLCQQLLGQEDFNITVHIVGTEQRLEIIIDDGAVALQPLSLHQPFAKVVEITVQKIPASLSTGTVDIQAFVEIALQDANPSILVATLCVALGKVLNAKGAEKLHLHLDPWKARLVVRKRARADPDVTRALVDGQVRDGHHCIRLTPAKSRKLWMALGMGSAGRKGQATQHALLQYWMACRKLLHGASSISVAVDCSTIGRKEIMAGMLVTASDAGSTCIVLPPQAAGDQGDVTN